MSALHNNNGVDVSERGTNGYYDCPARPDLEGLTGALKLLTDKIDNLIQLNRDVIRWLLIVVCIIALGRSAIDLGKSFFQSEFGVARAQTGPVRATD